MGYRTPPERRSAVRDALERLRGARSAVLTTHVNADGDGAGSEAALQAWLRSQGTEAWIVNPTPFPEGFAFLLPEQDGVVDATSAEAKRVCAAADLAVVLDTGEPSRIGRVNSLIGGMDTVVVDHHPAGGERSIGGLSLRDATACATGELVYDLVAEAGGPWLPEVVRGIYVAILTDTGSFRFSNTTAAVHLLAADLVERGVEPEAIYRKVYGASPLRALRLLHASLETLDVTEDGAVAWMRVPWEAYERLAADTDDLEGFVDYPRSVEGVEVGLLFRRTEAGDTKISLRSAGDVDVNRLARRFGGGGHAKAAGALVSRPPDEVIPEVVEAAGEAVRRQWARSGAGEDGM